MVHTNASACSSSTTLASTSCSTIAVVPPIHGHEHDLKLHLPPLPPSSLKLERTIEKDENSAAALGWKSKISSRSQISNSSTSEGGHSLDPEPKPRKIEWDGPDDPTNPQNWSVGYKWFITAICALLTLNVTFASSAPTSGITTIERDLHIPPELSYFITSIFLLGYVVGPLLWAPGSELVGRRPIFIFTGFFYCLFYLGQAPARDIQTLLVCRFFCGVFASAPLSNCGGVIADIWDAVGRGKATSVFAASAFVGPVMGPIVGGFLASSKLGWRWIFWVLMIFSGFCFLVALVFLPETYAPVLLQQKAIQARKQSPILNRNVYAEHEHQDWSFKATAKRTVLRPFHMLATEPILLLVALYSSVVYGILYILFEAFPIIFIEHRSFSISQNGLVFIGVGIGTTLGALINYFFIRDYPELMKTWRGFPPPEERLRGAMLGSICLVVGIFWLGWTGEYTEEEVRWYVPALATVLVGMSFTLIFISFITYLVDTYLMYSASAVAANTIMRSAVGAACPLFATQMFQKMGVNWACTLIGLVGLVLAPSPFLFYKYGKKVRGSSLFAPCLDLKVAAELEEEKKATLSRV